MTNPVADQQCIFCLNFFAELTEEHVIPDAIGGSLVIKLVCKDCNSYLGSKVDVHLVSNFIVNFVRHEKGLLGRRKNLRHPLSYGKLVERPEVGVRLNFGEEGPRKIVLDTNVRYYTDEDGTQRVQVSLDKSNENDLPEILDKIAVRMRAKGLEIDPTSIISEHRSMQNPEVSFHHEISIVGIEKAILKIVYEIACHEIGPEYLSSENGIRIRSFIMDSDADLEDLSALRIRGQMGFHNALKDMFKFIQCDHLIVILGQPARAIYVRVFDFYGALVLVDDTADIGLMEIEGAKFMEFDVASLSYTILNMSEVLLKHLPES